MASCNYLPNRKQLVIFRNPKDAQGLSYICDLETKSWIKAPSSEVELQEQIYLMMNMEHYVGLKFNQIVLLSL